MKRYGLIIAGVFLALFCALLGLATAMTPAPSSGDKLIVLMSTLCFFVGIGLVVTGIVKAIRHKGRDDA